MKHFLAACACVSLAGCSSPSASTAMSTPHPSPSPFVGGSPTTAAVPVAGGCGTTQVYLGGEPDWLTQAGAGNNPSGVPYFITSPAIAAGFLFSHPLRSGAPSNPGNKILWVVGIPRNENELSISSHPLSSSGPMLQYFFPDNASPGEIYPSEVDVPTPGCWHFDVAWGPNHTSVDLVFA